MLPPAIPFGIPPLCANMFCCIGLCCAEGLLNMDKMSAVVIFFCSGCCWGCPGCCCIWPLPPPPGLLPMLANRSNSGSLFDVAAAAPLGTGAAVFPPTEACTADVASKELKSPKSSRSTTGAGGGAGAATGAVAFAALVLRTVVPPPPPGARFRAARSSTRFRAASEGFLLDETRRRCTPDTTFSCSLAFSICATRSKAVGS
mmetsp:Transcript_19942/g.36076  ORF Transcript_19942/g.36076 Transcript_19942/m.36076 type:complete len:202 (-) Transcript_19942:521-1126(-)